MMIALFLLLAATDSMVHIPSTAPAAATPTEAPIAASARAPTDPTPVRVCSKGITDHCIQRGALLRLMRKNRLLPAGDH